MIQLHVDHQKTSAAVPWQQKRYKADLCLDINDVHVADGFCSVKFMDKIRYVHTLEELSQIIPMEHVQIPECVLQ